MLPPTALLLISILTKMQALWQLAAVSKSTVYARQEAAAAILSSAKRHSDAEGVVQRLLQRFPEVVDQLIRLCNHSGGDKRCFCWLFCPFASTGSRLCAGASDRRQQEDTSRSCCY